jgi:hypothetical protein
MTRKYKTQSDYSSKAGQKYSKKIIIRFAAKGYWYEKYGGYRKISEMSNNDIEQAKNILINYYQGVYHPKYDELDNELFSRCYHIMLKVIGNKYLIEIIRKYI